MANRIAVVTGAGSGIGRASALNLLKTDNGDPWDVVLVGRRKDALEETAGMGPSGRMLVAPTDVSDPEQVDALLPR